MPQQDIQTVIKDPKFLALDGDSQVQVLQHMRSLQPAAAPTSQSTGTPPPPPDPDDTPGAIGATVDVLKNVGKRAWNTVKGIGQATTDLPAPSPEGALKLAMGGPLAYHALTGAAGAVKTAAQQTGQQLGDAAASQGGDPEITALKYARAGTTVLSALNPLATGTVTDVNKLEDQGKHREAMGTAITDSLMMFLGGRRGKGPSESALNAKVAAYGKTGETVANLRGVMDDLAETARQQGAIPQQTVHGELNLINDTVQRIGAPIDAQIQAIGQQVVHPTELANSLRQMAREPGLARTPEGQAKLAALNDAYNTYAFQPWTIEEMAAQVQRLRQQINSQGYYAKIPTAQRTALMTDTELEIKKRVADAYSEEINNALSRASPNYPPGYFQVQRQKQARLIDLKSDLEKRIGKLEDEQALHDSRSPIERLKAHAYAAGGGVRAHVSGIGEMLSSGPMAEANKFIAKSRGGLPPRTAILGLPVAHLAELPPPPQDSDNQ